MSKTPSKTWQEARKSCRSYGGDLAIPRNALDNKKIYEAMKAQGVGTAYIGLYRVAKGVGDNTFYTVLGAAPKYTNWYAGEPNNYKGIKDCVQMVYKVWYYSNGQQDLRGAWSDLPCTGIVKSSTHFVGELSFKKNDD